MKLNNPFCFLEAGPRFLILAANTQSTLCWEQYVHGLEPLHLPLLFLHVSHALLFLTLFIVAAVVLLALSESDSSLSLFSPCCRCWGGDDDGEEDEEDDGCLSALGCSSTSGLTEAIHQVTRKREEREEGINTKKKKKLQIQLLVMVPMLCCSFGMKHSSLKEGE